MEEFIRANCDYPGKWDGKVEKIVTADDCTVTAARVFEKGGKLSFHVVSFFRVAEGKIASMTNTGAMTENRPGGVRIRT